MEAQPGNTIIDPITLRPLYTAPDFKTGIQGGFDANGVPKMGRIAGSEVLPQIAGETKRAEAAATAGYDLIPIETPNGKVMVTKEQAANLSGTSAPIKFTASNGVTLNFEGMTPQQLYQRIQQVKDPAAKQDMSQAFNEWAQSGQKPQIGIQLQSDAQKEAEVGKVKAENAALESKLKSDQERLGQNTRLYQQMTAAIPEARKILEKGNPTASGIGTLVDAGTNFLGIDSKSAAEAKKLETLSGWMTANVPRMEGPQSNADVENYKQMAAKVGDSMLPVKSRLAALDVLEKLQEKYAYLNGVTGNQSPPADASLNPTNRNNTSLTPQEQQELMQLRARFGRK